MFIVTRSLALAVTSILLTSVVAAQATTQAQQPQAIAQAPLPEQLLSSRRVFVANAPGDNATRDLAKMYDDVNLPYGEFYKGLRDWGKFVLVPAPSQADLIFEIRYKHQVVRLVILDPKTRVPLWWFSEFAAGGGSKNTRQKDLRKGIDGLLADLKTTVRSVTCPKHISMSGMAILQK